MSTFLPAGRNPAATSQKDHPGDMVAIFIGIGFLLAGVMTGAGLLVVTGLVTQYLIRPLVRWYLIG
jgi:hypothetical protein